MSSADAVVADRRDDLAAGVRRLIALIGRSTPPAGAVVEALRCVEEAAGYLDPHALEWEDLVHQRRPAEAPDDYFAFSPFVGTRNPVAPPVRLKFVDGAVEGTVFLPVTYEGPPGCAHGGVIAAIFDEILGAANIAAGNGAMTGKLTVRYRSPTPLYTRLEFSARSSPPVGRKVRATGEIHAGDRLCAEAEGIFVTVSPEKFEEITIGPQRSRRPASG